ncbi:ferritin [Sorangium sp. So ce1036]|uniref:ferritin family protein n=1 Tax=Sorangium sp. So ce1036 TaxID=3133328 RepID=UPI003F001D31
MSSENYHEPLELLSDATKERHRAIVSLIEELEAIDWYQQRAEACVDAELRDVLLHHLEEEVEHAMMNIEWLRRNDRLFREKIGIYVGSQGPIVEVEAAEEAAKLGAPAGRLAAAEAASDEGDARRPPAEEARPGAAGGGPARRGALGIGSLKGA